MFLCEKKVPTWRKCTAAAIPRNLAKFLADVFKPVSLEAEEVGGIRYEVPSDVELIANCVRLYTNFAIVDTEEVCQGAKDLLATVKREKANGGQPFSHVYADFPTGKLEEKTKLYTEARDTARHFQTVLGKIQRVAAALQDPEFPNAHENASKLLKILSNCEHLQRSAYIGKLEKERLADEIAAQTNQLLQFLAANYRPAAHAQVSASMSKMFDGAATAEQESWKHFEKVDTFPTCAPATPVAATRMLIM